MNIKEFYSDESIDVWKKVIGQDLHYHVGWGDGDIFYNAIEYLYQFIGEDKKVLDCGCGWGGTGKVLQRDKSCDVTGITNSLIQYEYIKNNISMNVELIDLHEYSSKDKYDVAIFIESYCHLTNPEKVLYNIAEVTNKIILREYHLKTNEYPKGYVDKWFMKLYRKLELIELMEDIGFHLTHEEEHYHYALEPTLNLWYNNINKLSSEEKTNHIRTLELSTRFLRRNMDEVLKNIGLSTLVFEK